MESIESPREFVGEVIGSYRVLSKLGSGGMGTVYRAQDTRLERPVALKLLPDASLFDKDTLLRFRNEARASSSLNHPNICTVYEAGEDHGIPFIAMELLDGQTLAQKIDSHSLPADDILRIGSEVCDALQCAHEKGIIHRDLKPSNIFIITRGDAKLLDFGVSKRLKVEAAATHASAVATTLTMHGQVLGTAPYMSPEQLQGKPVDGRSDIFSLGAVFYEMATGLQAHRGESTATILAEILRGEPRPIRQLNPEIPAELQRVIRKCLEKDPADRYQSAKELAIDLRRLQRDLRNPIEPDRASLAAVLRSRTAIVTGAVALSLIALALAVWLTPPSVSAPLDSHQITFSAVPKQGPLFTDGSRLYFQARNQPSEMSIGGGMIAPLTALRGMYLMDLSRDGSRVIGWKADPNDNVGRGSMWIAPVLGGMPSRFTDHLAQAAGFSPDGQSIVFADMGSLYSGGADGSGVKKVWSTKEFIQDLAVSPADKQFSLSLSRDEQHRSRLWRLSADGTNARVLPLGWPDKTKESAGQWTPDGRHFIFLSDREGPTNVYELVSPPWYAFWRKPAPVRLTGSQIDIQAFAPAHEANTLFVLGRMDQGLMQVFDPHTRKFVPYLDGLAARDFVISPDGQSMIYAEYPSGHLWRSKLDGTDAVELTSSYAAMEQWSPDGKSVVYSDWHRIYLLSADGGAPQPLVPGGDNQVSPTWTPDGKSIAFNLYPLPNVAPSAIQLVDLASRNISEMPDTLGFYFPSWSPDGKYMVAVALNPARMMLYSAETKTWRELKRFDVLWGYFTWARDSKALYMALVDDQRGMYRLTVPEGKWERMGGMERIDARDLDSFVSMTADGEPAIMSHTGIAQIYTLHWKH
ncbi:MAG TPA: protein kinase [Acidobacteriaceae bacterium]